MLHLEGGWPKDVNTNELDAKQRYQKKIETKEKYIQTMKKLVEKMESRILQNEALDIYNVYFPQPEQTDDSEPPSASSIGTYANILTVIKDPQTSNKKTKRSASSISLYPADFSKVAVAYCPASKVISNPEMCISNIWDLRNPSKPDLELHPTSPLTSIEYNAKESPILVAGSQNGSICLSISKISSIISFFF